MHMLTYLYSKYTYDHMNTAARAAGGSPGLAPLLPPPLPLLPPSHHSPATMPPKRPTELTPRKQRPQPRAQEQEELEQEEQPPLSPLPGHRWRPILSVAERRSSAGSAAVADRATAPSGLGFFGGAGELLVVRCGLLLAVWGTLVFDLRRKSKHRAWSFLYTHWNLTLLSGYSIVAVLGSLLAMRPDGSASSSSSSSSGGSRNLASRLTSLLFPLMVTVHPFLDLGYFLFLHRRMAARGGWPSGLQYLLGGMGATGLCKHLLNSVRSHTHADCIPKYYSAVHTTLQTRSQPPAHSSSPARPASAARLQLVPCS
jgi:hypothetical protein